MKIKVGVIFGGESVEHEVSVISAIQAINNIDTDKYEIVPIYIAKDKVWYTGKELSKIENYRNIENIKKVGKAITLCKINNDFCLLAVNGVLNKIVNKIDIAFPIVHGQNVEDGTLTGYLETIGIPYVGCDVLGAALGQDKVVLKQVLKSNNLPIVDYIWFYDNDYIVSKDKYLNEVEKMGYPVVVKPACLGSSVGISYVSNRDNIEKAIEEAIEYDRKVIVEKAITNLVEVNCSVIGDYEKQDVSILEEVVSDNDILTYNDKYIGNGKSKGAKGMVNTDRIIPANIDKKLTDKIQKISKDTFKVLNLSGICRIDFLIDKITKDVYINEPNTIPGSLAFYLWEPKGKKYTELLDDLINLGIKNYKDKRKKICHFDTNILKDFNNEGGIKK